MKKLLSGLGAFGRLINSLSCVFLFDAFQYSHYFPDDKSVRARFFCIFGRAYLTNNSIIKKMTVSEIHPIKKNKHRNPVVGSLPNLI